MAPEMNRSRRTNRVLSALALVIGLALIGGSLLLVASPAEARRRRRPFRGRIIVTQKTIPKQGRLVRWLRRNRTRKLTSKLSRRTKLTSWKFNYYADLRRKPNRAVLYLVLYERLAGGKYRYMDADYLKVVGTEVKGSFTLHQATYFKRGKRYQIRITLTDSHGREILFAQSPLITLM